MSEFLQATDNNSRNPSHRVDAYLLVAGLADNDAKRANKDEGYMMIVIDAKWNQE
jgi:hypothetical protein